MAVTEVALQAVVVAEVAPKRTAPAEPRFVPAIDDAGADLSVARGEAVLRAAFTTGGAGTVML